jgi:type IV pilus assembly protein PilA
MLNKLKEMRESREEGFTLIELLVVIVIIGVLAAIALPIFLNQQKAAQAAAVKSDTRTAVTAVATALVKSPTLANVATAVTSTTAPTSDGVTTTAFGKWDAYVVYGSSSALGGTVTAPTGTVTNTTAPANTYSFNSLTGKYTDNLPS